MAYAQKPINAPSYVRRAFAPLALAGLLLSACGCVPGLARITAKSSELKTAATGGVGWIDFIIDAEMSTPNVPLSAYEDLDMKFVRKRTELTGTNTVADLFVKTAGVMEEEVPLFFCDDESIKFVASVEGSNAVMRCHASLKCPIGSKERLRRENLPRVLQLQLCDDGEITPVMELDSKDRFGGMLKPTARYHAYLARLVSEHESVGLLDIGGQNLSPCLMLASLSIPHFLDHVEINIENDDSGGYRIEKNVDEYGNWTLKLVRKPEDGTPPSVGAAFAAQEFDLRVPEDSVVSVAIDFDALGREAPDFPGDVRRAIARGRAEGLVSAEREKEAYRGLDALDGYLKDLRDGCGIGPEDLHSLVLCMEDTVDASTLADCFGMVVKSSPLDWERIAAYCATKGFGLESETWFGREAKMLFRNPVDLSDEASGWAVEIVPDEPGITYVNGSSLWEARHGKCKADPRPSRNGALERNEVVRIVVGNMEKIPGFFVRGLDDEMSKMTAARISVYLDDGKFEVRAFLSFKDEETAEMAKKIMARVIQEGISVCERSHEKTALAWLKGFSVTDEGCVVKINSIPFPVGDILVALVEPLAGLLREFAPPMPVLEPAAVEAKDPAGNEARKSLEFRLVPEDEKSLLDALPEGAPTGYNLVNGRDYRRREDWKAEDDDGIARLGASVAGAAPVRLVLQADDMDKTLFHPRFVCEKVELTGERFASASVVKMEYFVNDEPEDGYAIGFKLDDAGREALRKLTEKNIGRQLAILCNGKMVSSPVIQTPIFNGEGQISGSFTRDEAEHLAEILGK